MKATHIVAPRDAPCVALVLWTDACSRESEEGIQAWHERNGWEREKEV